MPPSAAPPRSPRSTGEVLGDWAAPTWIDGPDGFPTGSVFGTAGWCSPSAVAEAGGLVLTHSLLARSVGFTEFMAGCALNEMTREGLGDVVLADFTRRPRSTLRSLLSTAAATDRIVELGPVQRASLRHAARQRMEEVAASSSAAVEGPLAAIREADPVVAAAREVATETAVQAWGSIRRLVAATTGGVVAWEDGPFRARVAEEFREWSPARQRELATADACVVALREALRGMDEDGRAQLAEVVAEQTLGQQEHGRPLSVEPAALALSRVGQVHDLVAGVRRALAAQRGT